MAEPGKAIVYTCPYVPAEWIAAHGLQPRRLIPLPIEGTLTIPRIEGLCPYARAFVNDVAASGDVDGIVVTTMCDQMRRVFDLLVRRVDVPAFLLNVPSTWQTVAAQRLYLDELKRLGRFLVRLGGHEPDKEDLVRAMLDQAHGNGVHGTPYDREAVPVAVVGGPLMQRDRVLFDVIAACGGRIVLDATETGRRGVCGPFDRRRLAEDPLMELAQAYFRLPDASRRPNSELYRWLKDELAQAGARGIIFHHYVWCDKWRAEFTRLKEWTTLPVLGLDSEGDGPIDVVRTRNRVRAFMEMLQ
jgi:benzoyl-CoA reductase/2-hydroxyglutaryl-CoA dehydratase subunit BcrC/BadD/HgdB